MATKNKEFYRSLGAAAGYGATCEYKAGWQRNAWIEGNLSCARPRSNDDELKAARAKRAAEAAKSAKARMAASHPDHGGTCEAFREAFADWKAKERYARACAQG